MKIISYAGKRNFVLEKDNQNVFEVNYQTWYSNKAIAKLYGDDIEIKPRNIWASTFDIFKNNREQGAIIIHWKGNITIQTVIDNYKENNYLLTSKGVLNRCFYLTNAANELILVIKPSMVWKKLSYNYEIDIKSVKYDEKFIAELLIYCGYAVNQLMSRAGGC